MTMHTLSKKELRACRACNRIIDSKTPSDEQVAAVESYDVGEWSGPLMAEYQCQMESEVFAYVGERFDMTECQMANAFTYWCGVESDLDMQARMHRADDLINLHAGFNLQAEATQ